MVTMDEVLYDLFVREFADDTALYGEAGSFDDPQRVDYPQRGRAAAMAGRPAHLEPGVQAVVLPRHLADPVSARPVPLPVQHPRPVELPARPAAARHVRSRTSSRWCRNTSRRAPPRQPRRPALPRPRSSEMAPEAGSATPQRVVHDAHGRVLRRSVRADAALSVRPAAARRRGERVQGRGPDQQPAAQPAADAAAVRRQLPDQHRAVEVPAPDRLSAVHSQAMGATAASSTRSTKAGCKDPPYNPFEPYPTTPPKTGRGLDRGVLSNALGGAFCPGARGQLDHAQPVDLLGAVSHQGGPLGVELPGDRRAGEHRHRHRSMDYTFNVENPLSQDNNFDVGLQPGDMTKYMALPWQADFNECTTNPTDVTYADWNIIYPESEHDTRHAARTARWSRRCGGRRTARCNTRRSTSVSQGQGKLPAGSTGAAAFRRPTRAT